MLYPARGKTDNCWSEQSPEKSTVSTVTFFWGHPVYMTVMQDRPTGSWGGGGVGDALPIKRKTGRIGLHFQCVKII